MRIYLDATDRAVSSASGGDEVDPPLRRKTWRIGMSLRCPIMVVECLVWFESPHRYREAAPDTPLSDLASMLASTLQLRIVPARELHEWGVSPEQMTEQMWRRLEYTDTPTAYSLLIEG